MNKTGRKMSNSRGMTMAELLMVVSIIVILGALAVIAVMTYQRSLAQVERDGVAKEIFVAAQNHLTVAKGEAYLGLTGSAFGTEDTVTKDEDGKDIKGDYFFVVPGNLTAEGKIPGSLVLSQMLPFGAIDETIRTGGSYIIRYDRKEGQVLDVFYCSQDGSRFDHKLVAGEYATVMGMRGADNKDARRNWDGAVLGWYGGTDAENLETISLKAPVLEVVNAEKLYVRIKDDNEEGLLRIFIKGAQSGKTHYLDVNKRTMETDADGCYRLILDEVTTPFGMDTPKTGGHFKKRKFDDMSATVDNDFIPGENLRIKACSYTLEYLSNIAYSAEKDTNSLFDSIAKTHEESTSRAMDTIYISNFRHLENLDRYISGVKRNATGRLGDLNLTEAIQMTDLNWNDFRTKIGSASMKVYGLTDDVGTAAGCYRPVELGNSLTDPVADPGLTYNGTRHRITNLKVGFSKTSTTSGCAGLFGSTTQLAAVKNLQLIDANVRGTDAAGALGGRLASTVVTNVLARSSTGDPGTDIESTAAGTNAGGLIGELTGTAQAPGKVLYCAAAEAVEAPGNAGGLIGLTDDHAIIDCCYSAGHTKGGSYIRWLEDNDYDVKGARAGGLIGYAAHANISHSYSTCSVSGTVAAGLAGAAAGTIGGCYATGYVDEDANTRHAFIGEGVGADTADLSRNHYYMIVNEKKLETGETREKMIFIDPVPGMTEEEKEKGEIPNKIVPLDGVKGVYGGFVEGKDKWTPAEPYDDYSGNNYHSLIKYYGGKYNLRSVERLCPDDHTFPDGYAKWDDLYIDTHYGDWPAPEVFIIND